LTHTVLVYLAIGGGVARPFKLTELQYHNPTNCTSGIWSALIGNHVVTSLGNFICIRFLGMLTYAVH